MFEFVTVTMEMYYKNRLLDIAHSRYRPGMNLRNRELSKSTTNIITMKRVRNSIYVLEENIKTIRIVEYLVDMELGTCSCTAGSSGAACRHHAAIAEKFDVNTIHLPPVHAKETRHTFAILVQGQVNIQGIEFYADLVDNSPVNTSHVGTEEPHVV